MTQEDTDLSRGKDKSDTQSLDLSSGVVSFLSYNHLSAFNHLQPCGDNPLRNQDLVFCLFESTKYC